MALEAIGNGFGFFFLNTMKKMIERFQIGDCRDTFISRKVTLVVGQRLDGERANCEPSGEAIVEVHM